MAVVSMVNLTGDKTMDEDYSFTMECLTDHEPLWYELEEQELPEETE